MFDRNSFKAQGLKAKYRAELSWLKVFTGLLSGTLATGLIFMLVLVYQHPSTFSFTVVGLSAVLGTAAYRYLYYLPTKSDRQRYSKPRSANHT